MKNIPDLPPGERRDWIARLIGDFCAGPANTLQDATSEPAWDAPLVSFARGDDPLWQQYKEYVGPDHWTPAEIFATTFPGAAFEPADLTVICWILPQTERTRADNRLETTSLRNVGRARASSVRRSTACCGNTWRIPFARSAAKPWRLTSHRCGRGRTQSVMSSRPPGRSDTPPMPRAWAPSACAMG
jgi:hypothetical protein